MIVWCTSLSLTWFLISKNWTANQWFTNRCHYEQQQCTFVTLHCISCTIIIFRCVSSNHIHEQGNVCTIRKCSTNFHVIIVMKLIRIYQSMLTSVDLWKSWTKQQHGAGTHWVCCSKQPYTWCDLQTCLWMIHYGRKCLVTDFNKWIWS